MKPGFSAQSSYSKPSGACIYCYVDAGDPQRPHYVCTGFCEPLVKDKGPPPTNPAPTPEEIADAVNKPDHYMRFKIEPIRFCTENALGFLEGNIVKYAARHDAKGGKEDLKKAIRYAVMLIKYRYKDDADFWKTDDALAAYLATL